MRQLQPRQNNSSIKKLLIIIEVVTLVVAGTLLIKSNIQKRRTPDGSISKLGEILEKNLPSPSPSPTPTPKPLTFAEMNTLYGPCVRLPVLMYHHVQSKEQATAAKQTGITVYTDVFRSQMEYLKSKNYMTVSVNNLINFFDSGSSLPAKSVLITFDDGYQDLHSDAYPILSSFGFRSVVFLPTGLMENPGYLGWGQIASMTGLVHFGNHTWSHKSVLAEDVIMKKEISTADLQLTDHGLNIPKIFAYPYGSHNSASENYLYSLGYKAAFTTTPGTILCTKQRLNLPRIRIGNSPLSNYGF